MTTSKKSEIGNSAVCHQLNGLNRDVHCLAGLVIDAVNMVQAVESLRAAAIGKSPYLMSTPNVNFLISCQSDVEFRDAILQSDLSIADGMPLIWIARLLGVPLPERIAGSDLFENLKHNDGEDPKPLSVFFFGGEKGVGIKARDNLNAQNGLLNCVGVLDPGFVSIDEMSTPEIISKVNESGADFLVVALGAVKGHIWLERNKDKLTIPVRSHLGAVINFEAGGIVRSPGILSRLGLEWLWRIKEEPKLWQRYWRDGLNFLALVFTRVVPLALWNFHINRQLKSSKAGCVVTSEVSNDKFNISLSGYAQSEDLDDIRRHFREAVKAGLDIILDFSQTSHLSASVLGTVILLKKILGEKNRNLSIINAPPHIHKLFRWQGVAFLLIEND